MNLPRTLTEVFSLRAKVVNVNEQYEGSLTGIERFTVKMTDCVGSFPFFMSIVLWTIIWLLWNFFAPAPYRFDPPTGFVLWLFLSNLLQVCLMPMLLLAQNLQGRHAEWQAEQYFIITKKEEREIDAVLEYLKNQQEVLADIQQRVSLLENKL